MDIKPDVKERVFAVADRLAADLEGGTAPKLEDVRREVAVGMNQVSAAMRLWRDQRRAGGAPVAVTAVPQKITENGSRLMAEVWAIASAEASAEVSRIKAEADTRVAEEIAVSSEVGDENDRLRNQVESLILDLEASRSDLSEAMSKLSAANEYQVNADKRMSEYRDDIATLRISEREAIEAAAKYRGQVEILTAQLAEKAAKK